MALVSFNRVTLWVGLCGLLTLSSLPLSSTSVSTEKGSLETMALFQAKSVEGAWKLASPVATLTDPRLAGATAIRIAEDGFFTVAFYHETQKRFLGTYGGTYTVTNGKLTETYEFNTLDSTMVGTSTTGSSQFKKSTWKQGLPLGKGGSTYIWERLSSDSPAAPLNGAWRISSRQGTDGKQTEMPLRARRTIKILSGNRFQWIAYNLETKEFFGTGGGTFTTQNGKYTEHIDFFSRDNSRVGQQLSFGYDLADGKWHHTGLSSTGAPINEFWQRHLAEQPKGSKKE